MPVISTDNPFAPPGADLRGPVAASTELASRLSRLAAAMIDGVIFMPLLFPLFWAFGLLDGFPNIEPLSLGSQLLLGAASVVLYLALHGHLLATQGQTIGKWLVGVRIVGSDGTRVSFGRLLGRRYAPFWLLSLSPGVGYLVSVVDSLFIFSASRRCLHDRLADTIVVRA